MVVLHAFRCQPIHIGCRYLTAITAHIVKTLIIREYKDDVRPSLRVSSKLLSGVGSLSKYFGTSGEIWLRLQARYDLEKDEKTSGEKNSREVVKLKQAV